MTLDPDSVAGRAITVLLVGNYELDGSISMQIFADVLFRELAQAGVDAKLIKPRPVLGRILPSSHGPGKWLGYIDRFLLFRPVLRSAAAKADVVHMCDNASAMYCAMLNDKPTVVTCNDMIAVRGALGELPEISSSWFGRYLQRWICRGLRRATRVACISKATSDDASRILGRADHVCVILDALNYPFQCLPAAEVERRLAGVTGIEKPFLLHVGGSHARKNRDGILRVFARVASQADLQLVFAGEALNAGLSRLTEELEISSRIVQIVRPDVSVIEALYNRALALIFPSRFEGFGWPPIEAQACGCPVVASDIPPVAEVLRHSAALHKVEDEVGMAVSVLKILNDEKYRTRLRQLGFENVGSRFQTTRMIGEYVALYRELVRAT